MSKIIRIGTRDSQLAMWQAKTVQAQLEALGHKTTLVPVKSTGDLILNKPLYELGITGVFTKTLDIAMLNHQIDIAVHSLKDVPTILPKGIVQAAVLKRGNVNDTLVFKNNEEFLSAKDAVIATGSLRRRAQWLNRYPTHNVVDLRGNVNSRLEKLESNDWNGAIFAAAGIGRLKIRPENAINLSWMIPAPAQGAIMIAAMENDKDIRDICAELNDEETDICTSIEREFLNLLEGGCTAPIGALARIKEDELHFKGVLLSKDGSRKIEVTKTAQIGRHNDVARFCSDYIIAKGGKTLIDELDKSEKNIDIFSTKKLSEDQCFRISNSLTIESDDAIQIKFNRIQKSQVTKPIDVAIFTSKNAVEALTQNFSKDELNFETIFCVGRRTKQLIEQRIGKVTHSESNATKLAAYISENVSEKNITYFCGKDRLDHLPDTLIKNDFNLTEIIVYETKHKELKEYKDLKGVLFYSPSGVESFISKNTPSGIAFCIGETTANAASKYYSDVQIAKVPTLDYVIKLVNQHFIKND